MPGWPMCILTFMSKLDPAMYNWALQYCGFQHFIFRKVLKIFTSSLCWPMPASQPICIPTFMSSQAKSSTMICDVSVHISDNGKNEPTMKKEKLPAYWEDLINWGFEELSLGKVTAFCNSTYFTSSVHAVLRRKWLAFRRKSKRHQAGNVKTYSREIC